MQLKQSLLFVTSLLISTTVLADCMDTDKNKSTENRQECLKMAHYISEVPNVNQEAMTQLLINPPSKRTDFTNGGVVYCRYVYQRQNGQSAKFRCARTNEKNQLFDSKGELVPEAQGIVSEGDEVYLTDANNQKLMLTTKKDNSKPRKALIMKIRYQIGDKRNVENYTSSAASRMFWAMGIPAHTNYMNEKVVCFGCGKHPFKEQKAAVQETTEFKDASIEIKFDAKRLYSPTQQAWKWSEINNIYKNASNEIRTEIEVLALASNFVGAIGKTDMQNAIVCTKFDETDKDKCVEVYAMAHDLGASFGSRVMKDIFFGDGFPRGEIGYYNQTTIFREGTCDFSFNDGGKELPLRVTAAGKAEFLKRAAVLTKENLKTIFMASHMGRLHTKEKHKSSEEDRWVIAVQDKLKEVQAAPCR